MNCLFGTRHPVHSLQISNIWNSSTLLQRRKETESERTSPGPNRRPIAAQGRAQNHSRVAICLLTKMGGILLRLSVFVVLSVSSPEQVCPHASSYGAHESEARSGSFDAKTESIHHLIYQESKCEHLASAMQIISLPNPWVVTSAYTGWQGSKSPRPQFGPCRAAW